MFNRVRYFPTSLLSFCISLCSSDYIIISVLEISGFSSANSLHPTPFG
nr:MAG TPA: hypothetical protein [Bacteriophage sp.]